MKSENPTETILVVDDETFMLDLACSMLKRYGYKILAVSSAKEALNIIHTFPDEKIDLALLDIVMPGMDGRRLADAALKRRPDLKVLFMTGYTPNAIIHNGVLDPGTHLLSKPFAVTQLAEKLRIVLGDGTAGEER